LQLKVGLRFSGLAFGSTSTNSFRNCAWNFTSSTPAPRCNSAARLSRLTTRRARNRTSGAPSTDSSGGPLKLRMRTAYSSSLPRLNSSPRSRHRSRPTRAYSVRAFGPSHGIADSSGIRPRPVLSVLIGSPPTSHGRPARTGGWCGPGAARPRTRSPGRRARRAAARARGRGWPARAPGRHTRGRRGYGRGAAAPAGRRRSCSSGRLHELRQVRLYLLGLVLADTEVGLDVPDGGQLTRGEHHRVVLSCGSTQRIRLRYGIGYAYLGRAVQLRADVADAVNERDQVVYRLHRFGVRRGLQG